MTASRDPSGAEMRSPNQTVWRCKIGSLSSLDLPNGADWPMRQAIKSAFRELTGTDAEFVFSGWGAQLTESELAVVENRDPASSRSSGGAPGDLDDRLQTIVATFRAGIVGDDVNGELAEWFRPGFLRDAADEIEKARTQVSALRQEAAAHLASLMASTDAVVELERERRAARQEAATLRETHTRRWNVEETSDGVRVCRGLHDKTLGCEWETFGPSSEAETLRAQLDATQKDRRRIERVVDEARQEAAALRERLARFTRDRSAEMGCFTGDCPHQTQDECDVAIRVSWCEQRNEIDMLAARIQEDGSDAEAAIAVFRRDADDLAKIESELSAARQEAETLRRVADSKSDQLKPALNSLKEIATITGDATQANQAKIVAAVKRVVEEAETLRGQLEDTILVGVRLSNCAYNLAQNDRGLDYRDQVSLDSARKAWDAAIQKHGAAARVAAPREPENR